MVHYMHIIVVVVVGPRSHPPTSGSGALLHRETSHADLNTFNSSSNDACKGFQHDTGGDLDTTRIRVRYECIEGVIASVTEETSLVAS